MAKRKKKRPKGVMERTLFKLREVTKFAEDALGVVDGPGGGAGPRWRSSDGRVLAASDFTDEHLANTLRYVWRSNGESIPPSLAWLVAEARRRWPQVTSRHGCERYVDRWINEVPPRCLENELHRALMRTLEAAKASVNCKACQGSGYADHAAVPCEVCGGGTEEDAARERARLAAIRDAADFKAAAKRAATGPLAAPFADRLEAAARGLDRLNGEFGLAPKESDRVERFKRALDELAATSMTESRLPAPRPACLGCFKPDVEGYCETCRSYSARYEAREVVDRVRSSNRALALIAAIATLILAAAVAAVGAA